MLKENKPSSAKPPVISKVSMKATEPVKLPASLFQNEKEITNGNLFLFFKT